MSSGAWRPPDLHRVATERRRCVPDHRSRIISVQVGESSSRDGCYEVIHHNGSLHSSARLVAVKVCGGRNSCRVYATRIEFDSCAMLLEKSWRFCQVVSRYRALDWVFSKAGLPAQAVPRVSASSVAAEAEPA